MGTATIGIQRVDPAVAVVIHPVPNLLSQLKGQFPLAGAHVFPVPQIELAAEVKQQSLNGKSTVITFHYTP